MQSAAFRRQLDDTELLRRHRHLIRALRWVAILTTSEALTALRGTGSEAVWHFGGPAAAIRAAWLHRHTARRALAA